MDRNFLQQRLDVIVNESMQLRTELESLSSQTKNLAARLNVAVGAENELRYLLSEEMKLCQN